MRKYIPGFIALVFSAFLLPFSSVTAQLDTSLDADTEAEMQTEGSVTVPGNAEADVRGNLQFQTVPPADMTIDAKVELSGDQFDPSQITITAGETIQWENTDAFAHTVTGFGADVRLARGETFTHTFESSGTYEYECTIHPGMEGTVVVLTSDTPTAQIDVNNEADMESQTEVAVDEEEDEDEDENEEAMITICHIPSGNAEARETIKISEDAWAEHEAHGDVRGECEYEEVEDKMEKTQKAASDFFLNLWLEIKSWFEQNTNVDVNANLEAETEAEAETDMQNEEEANSSVRGEAEMNASGEAAVQ